MRRNIRLAWTIELVVVGLIASCDIQAAPEISGTSSYVVAPLADTYVDSDLPDTNFGLLPYLQLKGNSRIPLLRFGEESMRTLVPSGSSVGAATLTLTVRTATSCAAQYEIHRMERTWSDTGATWNCANETAGACATSDQWSFNATRPFDPTDPTTRPFADALSDVPRGCVTDATGVRQLVFDVTGDVRDFVEGRTLHHHGWMIYDPHAATILDSVDLSSLDTGRPPRLDITVVGAYVPPEPTAPPLDRSRPTTTYEANRFLYDPTVTAPDHLTQWGVSPTAIEVNRAAVLHGRVLSISGEPLSGVGVSVRGHAEFGQTATRANGRFEMVVNGGGSLVLDYTRAGYIAAQRTALPEWNDDRGVPDVTLLEQAGGTACTGDLTATDSGFFFGDDSWTVEDSRGRRSLALYVPPNTTLLGSTAASFNACLREVTAEPGGTGPCASSADCTDGRICIAGECRADPASTMAGEVANGTAYTFALDGCVHEGSSVACSHARFSQDIYVYLRTDGADPAGATVHPFVLNLDAGEVLPTGSYDPDVSTWTADHNGISIVIRRGQGCAVDAGTSSLSLGDAELQAICANPGQFPDGAHFWRTPRRHFSTTDVNWNANAFLQEGDATGGEGTTNTDCQSGSILFCENRALGERIAIPGAPFALSYFSGHQQGRTVERSVTIRPIPIASTVSPSGFATAVQSVTMWVDVAGVRLPSQVRTNAQLFPGPTDPPSDAVFDWDGRDVWGRPVLGPVPAHAYIAYDVVGFYTRAQPGERAFGGTVVASSATRSGGGGGGGGGGFSLPPEVHFYFTISRTTTVGTIDDHVLGLGGWNLDAHHTYSPATHTLFLGTGEQRDVQALGNVVSIQPFGVRPCGDAGDASLCGACPTVLGAPKAVAAAADGSLYMASQDSGTHRLWRIAADGSSRTYLGEIGTIAGISDGALAVGRDPSLVYYAAGDCVWQLRAGLTGLTIVRRIGSCVGSAGTTPDGLVVGSPMDLSDPSAAPRFTTYSISVGPDDSAYFTDEGTAGTSRILRWRPDGWLEVFAAIPATAALDGGGFTAVEAGAAGRVFATWRRSHGSATIHSIPTTGAGYAPPASCSELDCYMERVVGHLPGASGPAYQHEGAVATDFALGDNRSFSGHGGGLATDPAGRLLFAQVTESGARQRLWRLEADRTVRLMAGARPIDSAGTPPTPPPPSLAFDAHCATASLPATNSTFGAPFGQFTVAPSGDLVVATGTLYRVAPAMIGGLAAPHVIASSDGSLLYQFDDAGRHLRTIDAITHAELLRFEYQADGRIDSVTDAEQRTTRFAYATDGGSISLTTEGMPTVRLALTSGYLSSVVDGAGHTTALAYTQPTSGLLHTLTPPGMAAQHVFTYDAQGHVTSDADVPDVGTSPPAPTRIDDSATNQDRRRGQHVSTLTSPEGRARVYRSWDTGYTHRRTLTTPVGVVDRLAQPSDGRTTVHSLVDTTSAPTCARTEAHPEGDCSSGVCVFETTVLGDTGICVPHSETIDYTDDPRLEIGADGRYPSHVALDRLTNHGIVHTEISHTRELGASTLTDSVVYPTPTGTATTSAVQELTAPFRLTVRPAGPTPVSEVLRDEAGRVTRVAVRGQHPVCVTYRGASRRPLSVRQGPVVGETCTSAPGDARESSFGYADDAGTAPPWLRQVTVGAGASALTTTFDPDPATGWTRHITLPGHSDTIDIGYDERGNVTSFRPPGRVAHGLSVTQRDLGSTYTPPSTATIRGAEVSGTDYDLDGLLRHVTYASGEVLTLDYEAATGLLHHVGSSEIFAAPVSYDYAYDGFGNVETITDTGLGTSIAFTHDVLVPTGASWSGRNGLVASVSAAVHDHAMVVTGETVSLTANAGTSTRTGTATLGYEYDADLVSTHTTLGARGVLYTRASAPSTPGEWNALTISATVPLGTSSETSVRVDAFGALRAVTTTGGGSATSSPSMWYDDQICTRDSLGRITFRIETVRGVPRGRSAPGVDVIGHRYDYGDAASGTSAGRLSRYRTFALGAGGSGVGGAWRCEDLAARTLPAPATDTTMAYDSNGNVTRGPRTACDATGYDAADRPSCGGRQYNGRGQLTRHGGDRLTYDLLGRLRYLRKGSQITRYDWDPLGRLSQIDDGTEANREYFVYGSTGQVIAWRHGADTSYFARGAGGAPDAMYVDQATDGTIDASYRVLTDERGSVRVVVALEGARQGQVVQRIDYDAWGNPTFTGDTRIQPFGFAGGVWLAGPGFWRFGARDYDPTIGAWTAHDPILFDGGENLYAYCGGDPVNCIDPSGLQADEVAANYAAGFGDWVSFGISWVFREFVGGQGLVDTGAGAYIAGEASGACIDIGVAAAEAGLRSLAAGMSDAARAGARAAGARGAAYRAIRATGQTPHHIHPLFGHPFQALTTRTRFPVGGLPPWLHSGAWNLRGVASAGRGGISAAHLALHNSYIFHEGIVGALYGLPQLGIRAAIATPAGSAE